VQNEDPRSLEVKARRAGDLALSASFWFLEQDPGTGTNLIGELRNRLDRDLHPLAWARATIGWTITTATLPTTEQD